MKIKEEKTDKEKKEKKMEVEMNDKTNQKDVAAYNEDGVDKNKPMNETIQKDKKKEILTTHEKNIQEIKSANQTESDDIKKDMDRANTKGELEKHNCSEAIKERNKNESPNSKKDSHKNSSQQTKENKTNQMKELQNEKGKGNEKAKERKREPLDEKKEETKEENKEENEDEEDEEAVCVKRIINVEISTEVKNFIKTFIEHREEVLNWCNNNTQIYTNKINEKTITMFFRDTENLNKILKDGCMNIDLLSTIIYFYNLYCTHNNKDKINFNDLMTNSHITYRGLYENIDVNSKTFKNLLKNERKYKFQCKKNVNTAEDSFWHYKRTYPYGMSLIVGMCLTFISGYYGALLIGYHEFTTRLICGVIFSYLGLILEVFFYIIIYEKSENIRKRRLNAIKKYSGLYKKIKVSTSQPTMSTTFQANVSDDYGLSTNQNSRSNLNETKKDK